MKKLIAALSLALFAFAVTVPALVRAEETKAVEKKEPAKEEMTEHKAGTASEQKTEKAEKTEKKEEKQEKHQKHH